MFSFTSFFSNNKKVVHFSSHYTNAYRNKWVNNIKDYVP